MPYKKFYQLKNKIVFSPWRKLVEWGLGDAAVVKILKKKKNQQQTKGFLEVIFSLGQYRIP